MYSPYLVITLSQDGHAPSHRGSAKIGAIQGYIDYMSAHILLVKATELAIAINDEWKGTQQDPNNREAANIQLCASFTWSTLQLCLHKSTSRALFGIAQHMYEFIMQQKKRSERTISLMIPAGTAASTAFAAYQEEQKRAEETRAAEIGNKHHTHTHFIPSSLKDHF